MEAQASGDGAASAGARYAVGIDLGTTHTVVAYADLQDATPTPRVFPIVQKLASGFVGEAAYLPSVLYAPFEHEPDGDAAFVSGGYAEQRASEVPGRAVQSAKSWLSQRAVDPEAPHLPWGGAEDAPRISATDAQGKLLNHIKNAWNQAFPQALLAAQCVVITVPASFDEGARALTVKAAQQAGLAHVAILEEPLAAFYENMHDARSSLNALVLGAGGRVLVVDVGGGTTDFSLVEVANGSPKRVATGNHLLLGGDNVDVALAEQVQSQFPSGSEVDAGQLAVLVARVREAKEILLSTGGPDEVPVTLANRGSQLVGGSLRATLSRRTVEKLLFDGFFPLVDKDSRPHTARSGLVATGLVYERDPAITRHLAAFLDSALGDATLSAVLLHGGMFHAHGLVQRMQDALTLLRAEKPELLVSSSLDAGVALGAVRHALALRGVGVRVRSTAARTLLLRVEDAGLVVLPRGTEEEHDVVVDAGLTLLRGLVARFELLALRDARVLAAGERIAFVEGEVLALPKTFARIAGAGEVPVKVVARLAQSGLVQLACIEENGTRHQIDFRQAAGEATPAMRPLPEAPREAPRLSARLPEALGRIRQAFDRESTQRDIVDLPRDLEKIVGRREEWSLDDLRTLCDALLEVRAARRKSQDHERIYWSLLGYTLRPGFGAPGDDARVSTMAALLPHKLAFPDRSQGWQSFFVAFRRVSAGLSAADQTLLFQTFAFFVVPAAVAAYGAKKPKFTVHGLSELRTLLAGLLRLSVAEKSALGNALLERTYTERHPVLFADLGRIGARVPPYGDLTTILPPKLVESWLEELRRGPWEGIPTLPTAVIALARLTGDRARDLALATRQSVDKKLVALGLRAELRRPLFEVVAIEDAQQLEFYGDSLPLGLRLAVPSERG